MTTEHWFQQRIPIAQLIAGEQNVVLDRMFKVFDSSISHYHQMMVLAGGIAGVVVPILHAQGETLIKPWFLTRAMVCLAASIVVGVLICAVARWLIGTVVAIISKHYSTMNAMIGNAVDERGVTAALSAANEAFKPKAKTMMTVIRSLALVGDLLFYGVFLRGLIYLVEGFAMK